jgi:hypothetical protein
MKCGQEATLTLPLEAVMLTEEDHLALWNGAMKRWFKRRPHLRYVWKLQIILIKLIKPLGRWYERRAMKVSLAAAIIGAGIFFFCALFVVTAVLGASTAVHTVIPQFTNHSTSH